MRSMEATGPGPETVARAAAGDGAAFRAVVDSWKGRVLAFSWRMTGDSALAEDLAQEVFLHLYRVLRRYDPSRPFTPWMRRVMTNVVLNSLRSRRLPPRSLDVAAEFDALEPTVQDIAGQGLAYGVHTMISTPRWTELRARIRDYFSEDAQGLDAIEAFVEIKTTWHPIGV